MYFAQTLINGDPNIQTKFPSWVLPAAMILNNILYLALMGVRVCISKLLTSWKSKSTLHQIFFRHTMLFINLLLVWIHSLVWIRENCVKKVFQYGYLLQFPPCDESIVQSIYFECLKDVILTDLWEIDDPKRLRVIVCKYPVQY